MVWCPGLIHVLILLIPEITIKSFQITVLCASSWGTNLALLYSLYYPDKVKGLIHSGFTDWIGINNRKVILSNYSNDSIGNFRRTFPVSPKLDSLMRAGFNSSKTPSAKSNSPVINEPEF